MSLSDEIKAAIGGDGKSRHQTRCLYDYWAIKAEELEAELELCLTTHANLNDENERTKDENRFVMSELRQLRIALAAIKETGGEAGWIARLALDKWRG